MSKKTAENTVDRWNPKAFKHLKMVKSNPMNKGNRIIILADANSNGGVNLLPNGPEFLVAKTPEDPDPPAAPGSWGDVSPKKKTASSFGMDGCFPTKNSWKKWLPETNSYFVTSHLNIGRNYPKGKAQRLIFQPLIFAKMWVSGRIWDLFPDCLDDFYRWFLGWTKFLQAPKTPWKKSGLTYVVFRTIFVLTQRGLLPEMAGNIRQGCNVF